MTDLTVRIHLDTRLTCTEPEAAAIPSGLYWLSDAQINIDHDGKLALVTGRITYTVPERTFWQRLTGKPATRVGKNRTVGSV